MKLWTETIRKGKRKDKELLNVIHLENIGMGM
jgi:hypothetical protein